MPNINSYRIGGGRPVAVHGALGEASTPYKGVNTNKQRRHEERSRRRWGNWGILGVPTALLWLEDECVADPFGECDPLVEPAMVLWP